MPINAAALIDGNDLMFEIAAMSKKLDCVNTFNRQHENHKTELLKIICCKKRDNKCISTDKGILLRMNRSLRICMCLQCSITGLRAQKIPNMTEGQQRTRLFTL